MSRVGTVGVLLLAAGRSARFGSDKRLAALPTGATMLDTCIAHIRQSGLPLLVCLRSADAVLQQTLAAGGVTSLLCQNAHRGMGSTLAEGIAQLPSDWEGVVVALGAGLESLEGETAMIPWFWIVGIAATVVAIVLMGWAARRVLSREIDGNRMPATTG